MTGWRDAYLCQARSDWDMWLHLCKVARLPCHRLHYLQMAVEKLGKALLIAGAGQSIETLQKSHLAFTKFLLISTRNKALASQYDMSAEQYRAHVRGIAPLAYGVEQLGPQVAHGGPNVEYPWRDPSGRICAPAQEGFSIAEQLGTPRGVNLLKLIAHMLRESEARYC